MSKFSSLFHRRYIAVTLGIITVFYLVTLRGIAGNLHPLGVEKEAILSHFPPFETSLERGRYAQIISLVEKHSFVVDRYSDFLKPDLAWYNGHYYSAFPPGVAILSLPFYLLGHLLNLAQVGAFLPTMLMSIGTSYLILRLAKMLGLSTTGAVASALFFALGSNAWAYSVTLSAHLFSAFFITLALVLALSLRAKNTRQKIGIMMVLWGVYGLNFFIDYPNLIILLPVLVYAAICEVTIKKTSDLLTLRLGVSVIAGLLGILPFLFLFFWYNLSHFHRPVAFTNTYNLLRLDIQGIPYSADTLSNDLFTQKPYAERFQMGRLVGGIQELLVSTDRGLFYFSPVLILSVLGMILAAARRRPVWALLAATIVADILLYASFDDPYGGWSFGPRYLIPVLPLLALFAGYGYDLIRTWSLATRFLVYLLFLASAAIALLGALTTNGVPPAPEAVGFAAPSNFAANWLFLTSRGTSSFFFSETFWYFMAPEWYYAMLLGILAALTLPIFLLPQKNDQTVL